MFYLQEKKLNYRRSNVSFIQDMVNYFKQRDLQGLRFFYSVNEVNPSEIISFANLLNKAGNQEKPLAWLVVQLQEGKYFWVISHLLGITGPGRQRDPVYLP
jgi:hypothetical protein